VRPGSTATPTPRSQLYALSLPDALPISVLEGIPASLPALARAQKVLSRADRAGIALDQPTGAAGDTGSGAARDSDAEATRAVPEGPTVADDLLAAVRRARAEGIDAEAALRARVRELEAAIHAAEADRS